MTHEKEKFEQLLIEAENVVSEYEQIVEEYSKPFTEAKNNLEDIPEPPIEREEMSKRAFGLERYMYDVLKELGNNYIGVSPEDQIERFEKIQKRYYNAIQKWNRSEAKLYSKFE